MTGSTAHYIYTGEGYTDISAEGIEALNICLFARNAAGTINEFDEGVRIYSLNIYNNSNSVVRDFIPCYSTTTVTNVDGNQCPAKTKGLYDLVTGKFYTNKTQNSDEDFKAGIDI